MKNQFAVRSGGKWLQKSPATGYNYGFKDSFEDAVFLTHRGAKGIINAQLRHVEWLSINNKPGQYYIEPDQLAEWFQVWKNAEIVEFKVALSQLDVHKLDEICR
jgi:hypothetical protein